MRVASTAKRLLKDDIFFSFTQKPIYYKGRRIKKAYRLQNMKEVKA